MHVRRRCCSGSMSRISETTVRDACTRTRRLSTTTPGIVHTIEAVVAVVGGRVSPSHNPKERHCFDQSKSFSANCLLGGS